MEQTSLKAYSEIIKDGTMGRMEKVVFEGFVKHGDYTDREMSSILGFKDPNNVRPRRNGLCEKGLMVRKGKRKCKVTGKTAIVWGVA